MRPRDPPPKSLNSYEYFIGSLVLYKEVGGHGIVDGQQRLTTVTMIICALRDAFFESGHKDLGDGLAQLIVRPNIDNKSRAVLASASTIPYFQSAIQKLPGTDPEEATTHEEKRLETSYAFVKSKIKEAAGGPSTQGGKKRALVKKLKGVRDRILGLKAVALTLDNDVDAYTIFETLNTRGMDLELSDLFRNHFTKCIPQGNATTDQIRDKFDALRKSFDVNARKLDDFILHFWLSKYEYTAKRKIYKQLKKVVKRANAKPFFDEFLNSGKWYLDITAPNRVKWKREEHALAESLRALRLFRVEQPNPFVLAVFRAYQLKQIPLRTAKRAIAAVEYFHFAFTAITSSRSSGGISQMFARHACAIAGLSSSQKIAKEIDGLIEKLKSKFPSRDEFTAEFRSLIASEKHTQKKALVQYVLHKLSENQKRTAFDKARMTIEHLASQSGRGHAMNEEAVAEIGNLAWVSQEAQEELGTKKIDVKIKLLDKKGFWVDDSLRNHGGDWDKNAIRSRTDHLAALAYDHTWRI